MTSFLRMYKALHHGPVAAPFMYIFFEGFCTINSNKSSMKSTQIYLTCVSIGMSALVMNPLKAAEIAVLSAGAVEPGLKAALSRFESSTGHRVNVTFQSAPRLKALLDGQQFADVIVGPPSTMAEQLGAEKLVPSTQKIIGRVGIGMAVKRSTLSPDIASIASFEKTLRDASTVVYNNASTGVHLHKEFERLGWLSWITPKAVRPGSGSEVADRLLKGEGIEVGFAAITEMNLYNDKGLNYVGPAPGNFQNLTDYAVVLNAKAKDLAASQALVKWLSSEQVKAIFIEQGAWVER
jgi:molybdate transport system substrate-binding protein